MSLPQPSLREFEMSDATSEVPDVDDQQLFERLGVALGDVEPDAVTLDDTAVRWLARRSVRRSG